MKIEQLSPAEKRERILIEAVPFRTILNLDGHNMLYLGVFEGSPVAFHTIWGLRTGCFFREVLLRAEDFRPKAA